MPRASDRELLINTKALAKQLPRNQISPERLLEAFRSTIGTEDFCSLGPLRLPPRQASPPIIDDIAGPVEQYANVLADIDIWLCSGAALDHVGVPLYVELALKASFSEE
jgi:hypothetical protein